MSLDERLYKEPLSLKIKPGDTPFELIESETLLGPEDWAWQFLRLNQDYRQAYSRAKEKQRNTESGETRQPGRIVLRYKQRTILADEDDCRKTFGLSTWLAPEETRLPKLEPGLSWFYPLSPIDISATHVVAPQLAAPNIDTTNTEVAFYVVTAGVFGRPQEGNSENVFGDGERLQYRHPYLFFLIDSSVPPAGQLLEIENFVGFVRKRLANAVCTLPPPFRKGRTRAETGVLTERLASRIYFPSLPPVAPPLAPGEKTCDPNALWSVARLDFRAPLKENINFIRGRLTERHQKLVAAHVAASPPRERFRRELSAQKQTDGHSLKAYAVIAELQQIAGRDLTPTEIEHVITERSRPTNRERTVQPPDLLDDWLADRVGRITGYIKEARRYVDGDYRWLIYSQKPDVS